MITAPSAPAGIPTPRFTTLAPGARRTDADLVEGALDILRRTAPGAQLVDRMLAVQARINVVSDADFAAMGHHDAHAFYDPKRRTMFLRRTDLADPARVPFAAVALAHEGTHLLDDVARIAQPFIRRASAAIQAAGGAAHPHGLAVQRQAAFELTMINEARAFTFAGQVARELGVRTPDTDPTSIASTGPNDHTTFSRVWEALLHSAYNPDRRAAAVRNF